jgi:hypothetical protein
MVNASNNNPLSIAVLRITPPHVIDGILRQRHTMSEQGEEATLHSLQESLQATYGCYLVDVLDEGRQD